MLRKLNVPPQTMSLKIHYPAGKLLLIVLSGVILIMVGHELEIHVIDLERKVQSLGTLAPVGFIGLFILLTPFFVSVDALCFVAGLLFPLAAGELYMIVATYLAAALIFVFGRFLFKDKVSALVGRNQKLSGLNLTLAQNAFKLMFLLRVTPLPFALLSYAFAVAPVRFWPYLAATSGILIYNGTVVYLGYTMKHIARLASGNALQIPYPLLIAGLILTLLVLFYLARIAGKSIDRYTNSQNPLS